MVWGSNTPGVGIKIIMFFPPYSRSIGTFIAGKECMEPCLRQDFRDPVDLGFWLVEITSFKKLHTSRPTNSGICPFVCPDLASFGDALGQHDYTFTRPE